MLPVRHAAAMMPRVNNPYESPTLPGNEASVGPTRVRYLVIALCVGMSVLLYLDRFAIAPIATTVIGELGLDDEQFAQTVSAFFFAYALCQVPFGWLSDRFGARWTLAAYVACWSLAIVALGMTRSLLTFTLMRLVLGAAQAGAYPAAASLLKRWVPPTTRARANTIVSMGGRAGNLLSQFLTPTLTVLVLVWLGWETGGWRVVFCGYGLLGIIWAIFFIWLYRDSPNQHPHCNNAERTLIGYAPPAAKPTASGMNQATSALRMTGDILTSPEVWLISILGIAVNVGWVFLVTWVPRFLVTRHASELSLIYKQPEVVAGFLTAAIGLGGMVGSITGGTAADYFVRKYGLKWGRRLPGLIAGVVAASLYLLVMNITSVWPLVAVLLAISFTIDFGLGTSWASYQDIGGRHVATILGIGNMCGNFGAAGFGYLIGPLAKADRWSSVFLIAAAAMLTYAACWLLFDARRPAIRERPA